MDTSNFMGLVRAEKRRRSKLRESEHSERGCSVIKISILAWVARTTTRENALTVIPTRQSIRVGPVKPSPPDEWVTHH